MNFFSKILDFFDKIFKDGKNTGKIPTGTLKGYGMVNYWANLSDAEMSNFMKSLKENGCNLTSIELFGIVDDNSRYLDVTNIRNKFKTLLKYSKQYDIFVFVNIVNWNAPIIAKSSMNDEWFTEWIEFFVGCGKYNVIIQAVSEWCDARNRSSSLDAKAQRWCTIAEQKLNGFVLSWNKGSRPTTASQLYSYIDYHSKTTRDLGGNDRRILCNNDCGSIIKEMGGSQSGTMFNTSKVISYAVGAISSGKSVNIYGYLHKTVDYESIKALNF